MMTKSDMHRTAWIRQLWSRLVTSSPPLNPLHNPFIPPSAPPPPPPPPPPKPHASPSTPMPHLSNIILPPPPPPNDSTVLPQAPEWYREDLLGQALHDSSISRSNLFLTTKLHPRHHGFNSTLKQMQSSFANLDTNYLDLVLLHYPRQVALYCLMCPDTLTPSSPDTTRFRPEMDHELLNTHMPNGILVFSSQIIPVAR